MSGWVQGFWGLFGGFFLNNTCREVESSLVSRFGHMIVKQPCQYHPSGHLWMTVFSTHCSSHSVWELCVLLFRLLKGSLLCPQHAFHKLVALDSQIIDGDFFIVQNLKVFLCLSDPCWRRYVTDGWIIDVVSLCIFFFSPSDAISFKLPFFSFSLALTNAA